MKVRKAVIPAVDFDTEMLPITSVVPKELLPVCGKPVIHYVVHEAAEAGIEEVIFVLSKEKEAIADYFLPNKKLEERLKKEGKNAELQELQRIWSLVKVTVVFQEEDKGLGNAILSACKHVGDESFAVLMGDSIIHSDDCGSFTNHLIAAFNNYDRSAVGTHKVESCQVSRQDILEGAEFEKGVYHAKKFIAKPKAEETASRLATCGRYVFKPTIFKYLKEAETRGNKESQFLETVQQFSNAEGLIGVVLEGERFGVRDSKGLLFANLCLTDLGCD